MLSGFFCGDKETLYSPQNPTVADLAKLKEYAQLIKKGTKIHNGLPLKKAQYIFSDKAIFDRFSKQIERLSDGQIMAYYIDFSNGIIKLSR